MSYSRSQAQAFGATILSVPPKNWYCPACDKQHVTKISDPHSPLHQCPKFRGAWIPFVEAGMDAGFRVNYRQDYLGKDTAITDGDGNVVQSVTTQRENGEDCTIFAPSANVNLSIKE